MGLRMKRAFELIREEESVSLDAIMRLGGVEKPVLYVKEPALILRKFVS